MNAPDLPPLTEAELKAKRQIVARLNWAAAVPRQRNLDNAILLAQREARGRLWITSANWDGASATSWTDRRSRNSGRSGGEAS